VFLLIHCKNKLIYATMPELQACKEELSNNLTNNNWYSYFHLSFILISFSFVDELYFIENIMLGQKR